jgi:ribosome-associated protein
MIPVTAAIALHEEDLRFSHVRSPGPGGQNVNKVATAVELRFDVDSALLPDEVKKRLKGLAGRRLAADGTLVIHAHAFRSQELNRRDAVARLVDLVRRAALRPKPRRPTTPGPAAVRKRLDAKKRRSGVKALRRNTVTPD